MTAGPAAFAPAAASVPVAANDGGDSMTKLANGSSSG